MKKLLTIVLVLVLALYFAGCGGGSKGSVESTDSSEKAVISSSGNNAGGGGKGKAEAFFNIFSSGTYHMKAKMTGSQLETNMETFVKGEMMASTMEMSGETTRMIMRDNKMYVINDREKTIMSMPAMSGAESGESIQTKGMNLTGSGTAQFNGKNLSYEEYSDGESNKTQYFLEGDKLAGIRNIVSEGTIDVIVIALDQNVPGSVFDIPSDYQQFEM